MDPILEKQLIVQARQASRRAYAPYSGFAVGAALLAVDGSIFSGCNVENASYGATICAERAAVTAAVGAGATRFTAIAIYTPTDSPTPPCGICRQVLMEFGPEMTVICVAKKGRKTRQTLKELLPAAFSVRDLPKPPKR